MCIVSLSSLSLSSEKKKKNKAKKAALQPTTGPYIRTGKLYFNAQEEIPFFKGETVEDPQYLVGASGLKEILFANMDEDVKGKGPGTYGGATKGGRHYIDNDVDESSVIVLGRRVTYDEMLRVG